MTIDPVLNFQVILTTSELRLVTQALSGTLKDEDEEKAQDLGHKLAKARAERTIQLLKQNEKLFENIEKAASTPVGTPNASTSFTP